MRLVCIRWIHKHSSCPLRSTITIPRCPHLPPQIWKHIQSHKSCCFWRCCTKHEAATNSHITALSQRWAMALSNLDWSLGACRLASVWSAGDLRAAPYFPLSSRMAIHGAVRRDYSDGVLHPPAIFRGYEWWRLISQWARSLSLSCPSVWSLTSSVSHYVSLSLSLSPQTARISLFSARESKQTALDLFPSQTHTTSLLPKPLTGPVHLISSSIYLDQSSFAWLRVQNKLNYSYTGSQWCCQIRYSVWNKLFKLLIFSPDWLPLARKV